MDAFGDTPISILPSVSKISSYYWQQMHFPCHVCRPTVQPCPTSSTRLEASNNVWKTLKETRLASARIAPTSPWRKKQQQKTTRKSVKFRNLQPIFKQNVCQKSKIVIQSFNDRFSAKTSWVIDSCPDSSPNLDRRSWDFTHWCQKTARAQGPCMVA